MKPVLVLSWILLQTSLPGETRLAEADGFETKRHPDKPMIYDVVVYGPTSAGVVAAVQAKRMGKSVVLVGPDKHLGGLSSGGLGKTDIGNKQAIGGLSREFYRRIGKHYGKDEAWLFEPHVAERVFEDFVQENQIDVHRDEWLERSPGRGVTKRDGNITSISMLSGKNYQAKMFIDATYEGDLMAAAGVSYTYGRESKAQYGETLNGIVTEHAIYHRFAKPVDPYVRAGDPSSGVLPGVAKGGPGDEGAADKRIQAYCFRMCLSDVPANRVPFPKPQGYNPQRYELLLRTIQADANKHPSGYFTKSRMPNGKTDTNNSGPFSTDNIGMNYEYPEANYERRRQIFAEHVTYQQGLMWFLANDARVPEQLRNETSKWGLAKDEFTDHGYWPHQMYIREARRMVGAYVMTQHNCQGKALAQNSIGLGAYNMDSHHVQRYVDSEGHVRNEGDVQVRVPGPYPIAFGSVVPKSGECSNLLVPVCLSATHISFGSIRMEPVFMVLGQSAATAACLAIDGEVPVQDVNYRKLREQLLKDSQVLD
ncbi:MAG: FAD-dependent oxidoreductase [Bythopirellula sp.]